MRRASRTSRAASRFRWCRNRWSSEYRQLIQAHIQALTTKFAEHRIDYTVLNTAEPLDRALFSYLSSRERMMSACADS